MLWCRVVSTPRDTRVTVGDVAPMPLNNSWGRDNVLLLSGVHLYAGRAEQYVVPLPRPLPYSMSSIAAIPATIRATCPLSVPQQ